MFPTAEDGDADSIYEGQDSFQVESNRAIMVTLAGEDLSNGSDSIATSYKLDSGADIQTAPGVHNAAHVISDQAILGNISVQEAGEYSANITLTVSAL